jgi:[acyl-carrier-protein] S-malonyltransferase
MPFFFLKEKAMKTALIFPGQGSQAIGMGKDLADNFLEAREVFEEVDEVLQQNLSKVMWQGDEADLTNTANAQPAIMAVGIAVVRVLEKQGGFNVAHSGQFVAGHSLGEYTALAAAKSLTLPDTARLLRIRGQAMQEAVPHDAGAMAAILGLSLEDLESVLKEVSQMGVCVLANDNADGQVVISGAKSAVEQAIALAKGQGAKRSILLNVSAPFHSPFMRPAAEVMARALEEVALQSPVVPLVANVTASVVTEGAEIKSLLVEQVAGRVRWRESIEFLKTQQVTHYIELGHGKVLSGLVKRIDKEARGTNIQTPQDIEVFLRSCLEGN